MDDLTYTLAADDESLLAECRVETFRSGGPGGQHQNKTESGVRLVHLPTGLRVESRAHRSQYRNRVAALEELRRRLEDATRPSKPRRKTGVPASSRRQRLEDKRKRSQLKNRRRPPSSDENGA